MENIKDKINENYLLTFDDIKKVVEFYVQKNNCSSYYLDTILSTNDNINAVASYKVDTKVVSIFYDNLVDYLNYIFDKLDIKEENKISYQNYQILLTILHEIRHIIQLPTVYSETTLGSILNSTLPRNNNFELYRRRQYLFPLERDAELFGDNEAHIIFSSLDKVDDSILDLMHKKELTDITRDYGVTSPFFKYLELLYDDKSIIKYQKILDGLIKELNMDLYTRLCYGFNISESEEQLLNSIVEKYNDYMLFPRQNVKRMLLNGKYKR